MRILAIEREQPIPIYQEFRDLLRDEAAVVWELQKSGIIREIWFTSPGHHVIFMLECASAVEARQHLARLPLMRSDLIDFTLLELCSYDGFERLFASGREAAAAQPAEPPEY